MREPYIGNAVSRLPVTHRQEMVSAEPIRERLHTLMKLGMSKSAIARTAGVSSALVTPVVNGTQKTMRRVTAEAFLTVDGRPHKQQALVLNVGCRRRLEGLAVLGYSTPVVAAELGVDYRNVWQWQRRRWVSWNTHEQVRVMFDRMGVDGGNVRTRNYALRNGFVHPLLWDDIDDPFALPIEVEESGVPDPVAVERLVEGKPVEASPADREAAFHVLVSQGASMTTAAVRVGFSHAKAKRLVAA